MDTSNIICIYSQDVLNRLLKPGLVATKERFMSMEPVDLKNPRVGVFFLSGSPSDLRLDRKGFLSEKQKDVLKWIFKNKDKFVYAFRKGMYVDAKGFQSMTVFPCLEHTRTLGSGEDPCVINIAHNKLNKELSFFIYMSDAVYGFCKSMIDESQSVDLGPICGCCGRNKSTKKCPCFKVRFCNSTCQTKFWPQHKAFCKEHRALLAGGADSAPEADMADSAPEADMAGMALGDDMDDMADGGMPK